MAPGRRRAAGALLLVGAALAGSGCYIDTQRFPGPMESAVDPLPPGTTDLHPAGPEEVLVVRIADPVHVRRPGEASSFPLYFYRKQARVNSGSWVFAGASGRVEILYPGNSSVTLYGLGSGVVGSESRGEPIFFFRQVDRASVIMQPGEQVRLLGGAVLEGPGGPFVIEHFREDVLRVRNRSQVGGRIAYRDEVFHLDPGHVLDLPLLEVGAVPLEADPGFQSLMAAGVPIEVRGDVEVLPDPAGTRLRANGSNELRGYGLRVRLERGEEILFRPLGEPPGGPEPAAPGVPDPQVQER